ncbi:hypothetical protein D3C78_1950320 [compost metagenome]
MVNQLCWGAGLGVLKSMNDVLGGEPGLIIDYTSADFTGFELKRDYLGSSGHNCVLMM